MLCSMNFWRDSVKEDIVISLLDAVLSLPREEQYMADLLTNAANEIRLYRDIADLMYQMKTSRQ
jgi:hypothetical protein